MNINQEIKDWTFSAVCAVGIILFFSLIFKLGKSSDGFSNSSSKKRLNADCDDAFEYLLELRGVAEDADDCAMENRHHIENAVGYAEEYLDHWKEESLDEIRSHLDDYDGVYWYDIDFNIKYYHGDDYFDCEYYDEIVSLERSLNSAENCFRENSVFIFDAESSLEEYYYNGNTNDFNEFVENINNFNSCERYF